MKSAATIILTYLVVVWISYFPFKKAYNPNIRDIRDIDTRTLKLIVEGNSFV